MISIRRVWNLVAISVKELQEDCEVKGKGESRKLLQLLVIEVLVALRENSTALQQEKFMGILVRQNLIKKEEASDR